MSIRYSELAGTDEAVPGELGDFLSDLVGVVAPIAGGALGTLIAPGVGTALGAGLGGAVGKAAKGGKSKGGAAPIVAGVGGITAPQLSVIVRELLSTVPPPVKQQVMDVIRAVQVEGGNVKHAQQALVHNIESKFLPQIQQAMALLKHARLQREATSEHRGKAMEAKRWRDSARAQREIVKRIAKMADRQAAMQAVIDQKLGAATVLPKGKVSYLGGKRLVDLLARK